MSTPETYHLLQLGVGNVGNALRKQITSQRSTLLSCYGVNIVYSGLFTSEGGVFEPAGLSDEAVLDFQGETILDVKECIEALPSPFIVIDTTSSSETTPLLKAALARGGSVVTANKKPLAGSQAAFDDLLATVSKRLYYETTVGAGLPVINTLQSLIATGDEIESIQGCFSGTLGFIFSELQAGASYSQAVSEAKARGFTEADPREDLSGMDVARKVVILARLMGMKLEPNEVQVSSLYPDDMSTLSVNEFMQNLPSLDAEFKARTAAAEALGKVLRYVATVNRDSCTVSLDAVGASSNIGNLSGPDNIVVIQTNRYHDNPLVVKGPGAGPEVTAAGVFSDVLRSVGVV